MDLTATSGRKENQSPSTSDGTARAARTGPRPAAAALGIAVIARHRGVAVPTAMSGWTAAHTPAATTTMLQPPSSPTHTRGTPLTPAWPWPTILTLLCL